MGHAKPLTMKDRYSNAFNDLWDITMSDEPSVVNHRLASIEGAIIKLAGAFEKLVVLEAHHAETRSTINRVADSLANKHTDHETRLRLIEQRQPIANLTSRWTIAVVVAIVSIVGLAAIRLVMIVPSFISENEAARNRQPIAGAQYESGPHPEHVEPPKE